jgi:hypothetical protein
VFEDSPLLPTGNVSTDEKFGKEIDVHRVTPWPLPRFKSCLQTCETNLLKSLCKELLQGSRGVLSKVKEYTLGSTEVPI